MSFIDIVILILSIMIVGSVSYVKIRNRKDISCGSGCSCSISSSCKDVRE